MNQNYIFKTNLLNKLKTVKLFIYFLLLVSISSCQKEDGFWNLKRDNHLDVDSKEFTEKAFTFEVIEINNPRKDHYSDFPDTWFGIVDVQLKIGNINDDCFYESGICWSEYPNPTIDDKSSGKILDFYPYIKEKENGFVVLKYNGEIKGDPWKLGSGPGSYNTFMAPNKLYFFRFYIKVSEYDAPNTIYKFTKYSNNISVKIP
jgi:hypothetical protein